MRSQLAHIVEMNHASHFQKVNKEIIKQLAALRARDPPYYGDGFWSQGRKLTSGKYDTKVQDDDMPKFIWYAPSPFLPHIVSSTLIRLFQKKSAEEPSPRNLASVSRPGLLLLGVPPSQATRDDRRPFLEKPVDASSVLVPSRERDRS